MQHREGPAQAHLAERRGAVDALLQHRKRGAGVAAGGLGDDEVLERAAEGALARKLQRVVGDEVRQHLQAFVCSCGVALSTDGRLLL